MRPPGPILLPMLHPAYLFRSPTYAFAAQEDWKKAVRLQHEGPSIIPPPYEEWQWAPAQSHVEEYPAFLDPRERGPWIVDFEATLDGRPVCMSIGHLRDDDVPIMNVPFLCQGGTNYWKTGPWLDIFATLSEFFRDPRREKGGHNIVGYDLGYPPWNVNGLVKRAWGIDVAGIVLDTFPLHHTCFAELRHSLSFCASISTDLGPYKTEVHEQPKDPDAMLEGEEDTALPWTRILDIDDKQLRCYCNDDVFATKIVGRGLLKEAE